MMKETLHASDNFQQMQRFLNRIVQYIYTIMKIKNTIEKTNWNLKMMWKEIKTKRRRPCYVIIRRKWSRVSLDSSTPHIFTYLCIIQPPHHVCMRCQEFCSLQSPHITTSLPITCLQLDAVLLVYQFLSMFFELQILQIFLLLQTYVSLTPK